MPYHETEVFVSFLKRRHAASVRLLIRLNLTNLTGSKKNVWCYCCPCCAVSGQHRARLYFKCTGPKWPDVQIMACLRELACS